VLYDFLSRVYIKLCVCTAVPPDDAGGGGGRGVDRGGTTADEGGRAWNLATKVMRNGVEVIVATDKSTLPGEPEVLRVLPSSLSKPITLSPSTLTDQMLLLLPSQVGRSPRSMLSSFLIL